MTATAPTPDQVRGLWNHMTSHFGSSVIDKQNAVEMKIVSGLLGALKILDQQSFMEHYCTTWGGRIYVPFTIGIALNEWSLLDQNALKCILRIMTGFGLCTHLVRRVAIVVK